MAVLYLVVMLSACNSDSVHENSETKPDTILDKSRQNVTGLVQDITGNYVNDGYTNRQQGNDWVGATVTRKDSSEIAIKIRSRADLKTPTCIADFKAQAINDSTYEGRYEEKVLRFLFSSTSLKIEAAQPENDPALHFFCSGGAALAGTYTKIQDPLEITQVDKTLFHKNLSLQGIGFIITSRNIGDKVSLEIQPSGLKKNNDAITQDIEGQITEAQIEDMNADGYPEVLVYVQSYDAFKKSVVVAVSVNGGKSVSSVYFPPIEDDPKIAAEYQGQDDFTLVENILARRFPIYSNGKPTGKTREILYKLKEGEAMRKLTPVKSSIF